MICHCQAQHEMSGQQGILTDDCKAVQCKHICTCEVQTVLTLPLMSWSSGR